MMKRTLTACPNTNRASSVLEISGFRMSASWEWLCENGANQFIVVISAHEVEMSRFVEGEDRTQQVLLPPSLEDYIDEDNPVRVVDAYIDELDLADMGFERIRPKATGRPAYHPATLLKIYLYGYLGTVKGMPNTVFVSILRRSLEQI